MITFWSRSSPFSSLPHPVPRPARLRPPSPHSVHRAWHRRGLGPCNGPPFAPIGTASEDSAGLPGGAVDQAGAALYGLPPTLAVQRLHIGLGHHHFGAGGAHPWLVLGLHRSAEKSTSKRNMGKTAPRTRRWSWNKSLCLVHTHSLQCPRFPDPNPALKAHESSLLPWSHHPSFFFLSSCSSRSTAASSSTAKRWWTSTSTVWSSPCRPTPSTSWTAPRSGTRGKNGARWSSSDGPGGGGAAKSKGSAMSITMVLGVCMVRSQRWWWRKTRGCKKTYRLVHRCTLLSTNPVQVTCTVLQTSLLDDEIATLKG